MRNKRHTLVATLTISVVLLAIVGTIFIFREPLGLGRINPRQDEIATEPEPDIDEVRPAVYSDSVVQAEPEPDSLQLPEPNSDFLLPEEGEPEQQGAQLFEKDGVTYLELEGSTLLLVNKVYALPSEYGGEDNEAIVALNEMMSSAANDGISLFIVSGYRSYETQRAIFSNYAAQSGEEEASRFSARPGHSEHQAGLAYDLNSLSSSFADTAECEWLMRRCADFGFILRYPYGSEWATGYMFEPWHYRYIGDAALAKCIMDSGLSLEEYAGLVSPGDKQENLQDDA